MTIDAALADLEHRLDIVEAALDAGEVPDLPDFRPETLVGRPTGGELDRFATAMQRLEACQHALREARVALLHEQAEIYTRRRAATAYAGEA